MSEPIHIISLGAGVQSSTMSLMAAAGEITPMPTAAVFADTQAEPKSVYTWLDWLEKQLPFPVHRVTAGALQDGALRVRKSKKGLLYNDVKIPAFTLSSDGKSGVIGQRNCTEDYKIIPILRKLREIAEVPRGCKTVMVVQWIGISLDESLRMKESRNLFMENRWPLIEKRISRSDCVQWMQRRGFPKPPRSACIFCPFHSDHEWNHLKSEEPESFARAAAFESRLQMSRFQENLSMKSRMFLHAKRVPLGEIDFSTEEERGQLNMFNNECEGMCGV